MDAIDIKRFFKFHGLDIDENQRSKNGQIITECPFCEKPDKLYINIKTGQYDCKTGDCNTKGNKYTFIKSLHEHCLSETTNIHLRKLAKNKAIPASILKHHNVAYNYLNDRFIFLNEDENKKVTNLYTFDKSNNLLMSSPMMKQSLFGLAHCSKTKTKPVFLVEGHWDYFTLDHCLRKLKKRKKYDILALPGASQFKEEYCKFFFNRVVYLVFDNDSAGEQGKDKTIRILAESDRPPKEIYALKWSDEAPEKYDIRDLFVKDIPKPVSVGE